MNCHDSQLLLHPYLDDELDLARSIELEAHIESCADCGSRVQELRKLRKAVKTYAPYHTAPPELRQVIQASAGGHPKPRRSWAFPPPAWMSAAAVLALAAIGLWTIGRSYPSRSQASLQEEVLAGHLRSLLAGHLTDVPSSDRHTVKPWFTGKLDFGVDVFDLGPAGFTLVGGRLDYLGGRTVASLVYKRREHVINLFLWPERRGPGMPLSDSVRGFQTVRWQAGGMYWWAISDLNRTELDQFAKLIVAEEEKAHPR